MTTTKASAGQQGKPTAKTASGSGATRAPPDNTTNTALARPC